MPFKSKAQRRKFHALEEEGKMPMATVDRWESETKGKLPERMQGGPGMMQGHSEDKRKKMMAALDGLLRKSH